MKALLSGTFSYNATGFLLSCLSTSLKRCTRTRLNDLQRHTGLEKPKKTKITAATDCPKSHVTLNRGCRIERGNPIRLTTEEKAVCDGRGQLAEGLLRSGNHILFE